MGVKAKKPIDWRSIKADFDSGMTQAQLCKKYKLKATTLNSKIKRNNWTTTQEQKAALRNFEKAGAEMCQIYAKATEKQRVEIADELALISQRTGLNKTNFKILKMLQNNMQNLLDSGGYFTESGIKTGASTLKDFGAVINPNANTQNINVTQNSAQITQIKRVIIDEKDE